MMKSIKYVFISLLLIILQTSIMRLISIEGIVPDVLAVWIVYIALKRGQVSATLWGFFIGLVLDFATGNFIGLSALSKTLCGFTAGYFFSENKTQLTLSSYRFLVVVLVSSLVQNVVYFIIFTRGTEIGLLRAVWGFGIATTLYTATAALLPMFGFSRKYIS